jgi:hypothetical protein
MPHDNVEHTLMQALGNTDPDDTTDPQLTAATAVSQAGPQSLPLVPPPQHHHQSNEVVNTAKDPFSVLSRIPGDIKQVRERLFDLEESIEFTQSDWDKYWP